MSTRRRLMMQSGGGGGEEYIKDGLTFWIDGIEKGLVDGFFTDLVYGLKYDASKVLLHDNYIEFIGNAIEANIEKPVAPSLPFSVLQNGTDYTIEIVCNVTSNGNFAGFGEFENRITTISYVGLGFWEGFNVNDDSNFYYWKRPNGVSTASIQNNNAIINYTNKSPDGRDSWGRNSAYVLGGVSGGSTFRTSKCDLYCLRVYNRKLTDEERMHNQQIDNERFHLGL